MTLLVRATGSRWHASGALHSRIVENSMAAAKIAKTIKRFGILLQFTSMTASLGCEAGHLMTRKAFLLSGRASNVDGSSGSGNDSESYVG